MAGPKSGEPLVVGAGFPISAFSPLAFTFRLIEQDLKGIMLPLFVSALVASLDLLVLHWAGSGYQMLILLVVWWPISSYCNAGMLSFVLRVARRQPYQFRDVWVFEHSVDRTISIALLKFVTYGALALAVFGVAALLERNTGWKFSRGLTVVAWCALVAIVIVVAGRISVAPVVVVDRGANPFRALYDSARLTRGYTVAILIYFVILSMVASLTQAFAGSAVLAALTAPGIAYLYLALRGEFIE